MGQRAIVRARAAKVVLALLCVFFASIALAPRAAALTAQDQQMKQAILLLRGYIDRRGANDFFVFPTRSAVRPGGSLPAPVWPREPWTGAALTAGPGRGHYSYAASADRRSYRLVGHLSSGGYAVVGGMPGGTKLQYNHRTREGAALLQQYVELWARRRAGVYPPASEVGRHAGVGTQQGMAYWPSNPWNHDPMSQGTRRGFFEYETAAGGDGYRLTMHLALGKTMVFTQEPLADLFVAAGDPVGTRGFAVWDLFAGLAAD